MSERSLLAKRLSFLIKAGVPIVESFHLLQKQTRSKKKQKIYEQIIEDVTSGKRLASSLARFPKMFGAFAINIIKIGEESGILDQNLQYLAQELQKQQVLRRKIIGSLIYPIFITLATLGVTSVLTIYIFPKLRPIFSSLHVNLPLTTRILIFTSDFLIHDGLWAFIGLIILITAFFITRNKIKKFRLFLDLSLLKIPLIGGMLKSYSLANINRTLGLLLKSGVKVVQALEITADTTSNLAYKRGLHLAATGVIKGEKISKSLEMQTKLFPDLAAHLIAIGETTGNLPETFIYLSEMYEVEVEEMTKNLSSAIEPVLMAFMGIVVGLVAISVITPVYEVTQHLQK